MTTLTLTVDVTDPSSIEAAAGVLAKLGGEAPAPVEEKPAKKTTARKKAAPKPKPEPKEEVKEEPTPEEMAADSEPESETVDREMVRAALKELGALEGKGAPMAILKECGAATMSALKDEDFEKAYVAATKAIATAKDKDPLDE